eukprot:362927-Chlamydomonas_euryale.AAC.4
MQVGSTGAPSSWQATPRYTDQACAVAASRACWSWASPSNGALQSATLKQFVLLPRPPVRPTSNLPPPSRQHPPKDESRLSHPPNPVTRRLFLPAPSNPAPLLPVRFFGSSSGGATVSSCTVLTGRGEQQRIWRGAGVRGRLAAEHCTSTLPGAAPADARDSGALARGGALPFTAAVASSRPICGHNLFRRCCLVAAGFQRRTRGAAAERPWTRSPWASSTAPRGAKLGIL